MSQGNLSNFRTFSANTQTHPGHERIADNHQSTKTIATVNLVRLCFPRRNQPMFFALLELTEDVRSQFPALAVSPIGRQWDRSSPDGGCRGDDWCLWFAMQCLEHAHQELDDFLEEEAWENRSLKRCNSQHDGLSGYRLISQGWAWRIGIFIQDGDRDWRRKQTQALQGECRRQEPVEAAASGKRNLGSRLSGVTQADYPEHHALPRHGPHPERRPFRTRESRRQQSRRRSRSYSRRSPSTCVDTAISRLGTRRASASS